MKKLTLTLLFISLAIATIFLVNKTYAAIAVDATSTGSEGGIAAPNYSWTHTVGSGSNRVLYIEVESQNSDVNQFGTVAPTYGGMNMTNILKTASVGNMIGIWCLFNPTSGANTVLMTSTNITFAFGAGISLTGVTQNCTPDATSTRTSNTANASSSITPIANNDWLLDFIGFQGGQGSATSTWTLDLNKAQDTTIGISHTGPITPASAQTDSWTNSAANWEIGMVALTPVASTGGTSGEGPILFSIKNGTCRIKNGKVTIDN